jgi:hypothetical protein
LQALSVSIIRVDGAEMKKVDCNSILTQLVTQEDFIAFICCESLKFYVIVGLLLSLLVVRGYNLSRQVNLRSDMSGGSVNMETEAVRDLFTKKQALLLELRNYELNSQFSEVSVGEMGQQLAVANQYVGIIPVSCLALKILLCRSYMYYVLNLNYFENWVFLVCSYQNSITQCHKTT